MFQPAVEKTFRALPWPRWRNYLAWFTVGFGAILLMLFGPRLGLPELLWLVLGPLAAMLSPAALLWGTVVQCRLDEDGLTCQRWFTRRRRWPWASLGEVTVEPKQVRIATREGELRLGWEVVGRERLARMIADHRAAEQHRPEPAELSPEQLEAWLGLESGQTKEVTLERQRRSSPVARGLLVAALLALGLPLLAWAVKVAGLGPLFPVTLALVFTAWSSLKSVQCLEVGGDGLHLRGARRWQFIPWAAVRAVTEVQDRPTRVLQTDHGDLYFPAAARRNPEVERLLDVARRVVEAREQGQVPRQTEAAPDAALSRAEHGVTVERGLSRDRSGERA